MPFYKITIYLEAKEERSHSGKLITAVREFKEQNIDRTWHILQAKCESKWGPKMRSFDCVMISKRSADYRSYIKRLQQNKYNMDDDMLPVHQTIRPENNFNRPANASGKYRDRK